NLSAPSIINCTIAANTATANGGAIYSDKGTASIANSIVWGNKALTGAQIRLLGGAINASYSDIQGGWVGLGNIAGDPLFLHPPSDGADGFVATLDDDYGDLTPGLLSPVIDAGNNSIVPASVLFDLASRGRLNDVLTAADTGVGVAPVVDIGAFEAAAIE